MAKKFTSWDLDDIEKNQHKMYKRIHISSSFHRSEDGSTKTSYEMNFFHKTTRTYYTVTGIVRRERGYSWISWNIDSIKRDGKYEKWMEEEDKRERARKERLRWDESGEWM